MVLLEEEELARKTRRRDWWGVLHLSQNAGFPRGGFSLFCPQLETKATKKVIQYPERASGRRGERRHNGGKAF